MTEEPAMYTLQDVKQLRDELGCSLLEAKKIFDKRMLMIRISQAKTVEDLKPLMLKILDMT